MSERESLVGRAGEAAVRADDEWFATDQDLRFPTADEPRMRCTAIVAAALGVVADHCTTEAIRESEASFRLPAVDQQALGAIVAFRSVAAELRETPE